MGQLVVHGNLKLNTVVPSGTGDNVLTADPSTGDLGQIGSIDTSTYIPKTLTSAYILVGNGSNVATGVAVSGDITMSNAGVVGIASGVIVNDDVNASAAIALSKLAATTASRALVSDGSGFVSASAVTSTELGYVSGVTSAIQTQLNAKVATATLTTNGDLLYRDGTGTVTRLPVGTNGYVLGVTAGIPTWEAKQPVPNGGTTAQYLAKNSNTDGDVAWVTLTASKITDVTATAAELNITDGLTATTTELNYSSGVTSAIQTQLDAKQATITGAASTVVSSNLTANRAVISNGSGKLDVSTATDTEIGYLSGVTSPIQGQIDAKQNATLTQNAIWVGNASNVPTALAAGTAGQVLTISAGAPTWVTPGSGGTVTSVQVSGGTTGMSFSGGPITTTGTMTMTGTLDLDNGGTGASLADPGADRIMFWDDSAGAVTWLTVGSGLSITTTTISATFGGSTGVVDNAILRADGTGGNTVQASDVYVDDSANVSLGVSSLAGASRSISVVGSASNISLDLVPKGSSPVQIGARYFQIGRTTDGDTFRTITSEGSATDIVLDIYSKGTLGWVDVNGTFQVYDTNNPTGERASFQPLNYAGLRFDEGNSFFKLKSTPASGTSADLVIQAGYDTGKSNLYLDVETGGADEGNIGFMTTSVSDWQDMDRGFFEGNATTAPTDNPISGIFRWVSSEPEGSNMKIRTTGGHFAKPVLQAKVTIAGGATLRAIGSAPQTIIAAPGSGKFINVMGASVSYNYNSAVYNFSGTEVPVFKYSGGTGSAFAIPVSVMNGGADFNRSLGRFNTDSSQLGGIPAPDNTAFIFTTDDAGDATTGDGDLDIVVYYTIETTNT